jgi:hypothetical protein
MSTAKLKGNCPVTGRLGKKHLAIGVSEHINNFKKRNPKSGNILDVVLTKLKVVTGTFCKHGTRNYRRNRDYIGGIGK